MNPRLRLVALAAALAASCTQPGPAGGDGRSTRPLLSVTPYLVEDLHSAVDLPYYDRTGASFTQAGSTVFFTADDTQSSGVELWKSDGTPGGTQLLSDVLPGRKSSNLSHLVAINGRLFFAAETADSPWAPGALWTSDGTAAGTRPIAVFGAPPEFIVPAGGALYVGARALGSNGFELYASNGDIGGTTLVKAIPGAQYTGYETAAAVGSTLFFDAYDATRGHALWKSDGTDATTVLVKDPLPSNSSRDDHLLHLTALGGVLLFEIRGDGDWRPVLWRSDGTDPGTYPLRNLQSASGGAEWSDLVVAGGYAFLRQWTAEAGLELWRTDGTVAGTQLVADVRAGTDSSQPLGITARGAMVYFIGNVDAYGHWELFRSDGTAAGTIQLTSLAGSWSVGSDYGFSLAAGPDALYFLADQLGSPSAGTQLWKTDGTPAGTTQATTSVSFPYGSSLEGWFGKLYLTNEDGSLWTSDGTNSGTGVLVEIFQGQRGAAFGRGMNLGGSLVVVQDPGGSSSGAISSDGTAAGTGGVTYSAQFTALVPAQGQGFVWQRTWSSSSPPVNSYELHATDGTAQGTRTLMSGSTDSTSYGLERFPSSAALGRNLLFSWNPTGSPGLPALWKSDGTPAGTAQLTLIQPDNFFVLEPRLLASARDRVYFAAGYGWGYDWLYVTDGTAAGTRYVRPFDNGASSADAIKYIAPVDTRAFFWAETRDAGVGLWASDGTPDSGVRLMSFASNDRVVPGPATVGALNGELYFATSLSSNPPQLWKTDGGTVESLHVFAAPDGGPAPMQFGQLGDSLLFWAFETATGYELWRTDGTPGGTALVKDINPGPASSVATPDPFIAYSPAGPLLFAASDGVTGLELWETDGTPAGTALVADLAPGPASSSATPIGAAGNHVFIDAWTPDTGRELWAITRPVTDTTPPSITCPAAQSAEAQSPYGGDCAFPPATATDDGPTPVVRYSQYSSTYFPMGTTTVTATAFDQSGNTASCSFDLTVRDTTAPAITCPAPKTFEADRLDGGVFADDGLLARATDLASTPIITYAPPAGSVLPMGTATVTATARDDAANSSTCQFDVTIRDTTAPALTCPDDIVAEATGPEGANVSYPGLTASDVASSVELIATPPAGQLPLGSTSVNAVARDAAGNQQTCSFNVTVRDTTLPALTCPDSQTVLTDSPSGATVTWPAPTASDAVSTPTVTTTGQSGALFAVGSAQIGVTATDAAGNSASCRFTVTVLLAGEDAGTDGGTDGGPGAGADAGTDAGVDAGTGPGPHPAGCGCQSGGGTLALAGLGLLAALRRRGMPHSGA